MSRTVSSGSKPRIASPAPPFRGVQAGVFAERAARLNALASGHALEAMLRFAAALCEAQAAALAQFPTLQVPDERTLEQCMVHGMPPIAARGSWRGPEWRDGLRALSASVDRAAVPARTRRIVDRLAAGTGEDLDVLADAVLASDYDALDPGLAPFVGAALQAYWVKLARQLGTSAFAADAPWGTCPACGSYPVAGVVRADGAGQPSRYLVCALCATEWHLASGQCSACEAADGIEYLGIQGAPGSVKAETCSQCQTYLKQFYLEQDRAVVPAADDLATLALDMLVFEQGYGRLGANLLLTPDA
jgi:FdhE protein